MQILKVSHLNGVNMGIKQKYLKQHKFKIWGLQREKNIYISTHLQGSNYGNCNNCIAADVLT